MLVMALWCISLLGVFSISLGFGVRQKASLLNRLTTLDALYPIAYSGVEKAKSLVHSDMNLDVDNFTDAWAAPSATTKVAGGKFSFIMTDGSGVVDEERKINLNNTSVEIVFRLFQRVSGLGKDEAEELVYNLIDWMDSDSFFGHPQFGAEASYYENLKKPYTAKNAAYEVMDELLLVKGMTPEIFEKILPYVTIYGTGQVNMNTASREVLAALGFSPKAVDIIASYRAGADGVDGTADDRFFSSVNGIQSALAGSGGTVLDPGQEALLSGLVMASRVGVSSSVFSVRSLGVLEKNGASMEVEAYFNRRNKVFYQRAKDIRWPAQE
jgi:general secretion pathway protein K